MRAVARLRSLYRTVSSRKANTPSDKTANPPHMLNTSLPCNSVTAIVAANRFNEVCYVSRDRIFRGHGQPAQPLYASRYSAVVCWLSRPEAPANRHAVRDGSDVYTGRQSDHRCQRLGGQRDPCRTLACSGVVEPGSAGADLPVFCPACCRACVTPW